MFRFRHTVSDNNAPVYMGGTVGERTFEALLRFLTEAINRILISSGVYRSASPWGQGDHIGCDERRVCVDGGAHFVNWPPSRANKGHQ